MPRIQGSCGHTSRDPSTNTSETQGQSIEPRLTSLLSKQNLASDLCTPSVEGLGGAAAGPRGSSGHTSRDPFTNIDQYTRLVDRAEAHITRGVDGEIDRVLPHVMMVNGKVEGAMVHVSMVVNGKVQADVERAVVIDGKVGGAVAHRQIRSIIVKSGTNY